jgi:RNA polymerase sigma factor (sigma-70 family)
VGDVSESQLWENSKRGDGHAFGAIFDLHQGRLHLAALRVSETAADAEDLVAAAFLELWRRRDSVRVVDGSVLPWMLVTLDNLGRNAARATRRHRRFLSTLPGRVTEDVALDRVEQLQAERRAMSMLRSLPATDAAILALTAFEGLTAADAASALGISAQTARARLSRARRRARIDLFPEGTPS